MTKVVVVGNPNPEFQQRLESIMKDHAANVEIAFTSLHEQAVRAYMTGNLNKTYHEWVEENSGLDTKIIDAEFVRYPYPEGNVTGRVSGYAPDTQELVPRRPLCIQWPTTEDLSGETEAGLSLGYVDYSHLEERVLAHMAFGSSLSAGSPSATQGTQSMKTLISGAAALAAVQGSAIAAAQGFSDALSQVEESVIPNHVSIDKDSPHYWPHYRQIGVKIDGEIRKGDVHEFNVSEGWALVRARNNIGQFKIDPDNTQQFLTVRIEGKIEPYLKKPLPEPEPFRASDQAAIDAAEAKRRRKAEKLKAQANGR